MNVAICDDNIYMASKIEEIVSSCFHDNTDYFESEVYSSGEDLLDDLNTDPLHYQLYILDIEMKEINGLQVAAKIREADQNAIIIFITSHDELMPEAFEVLAFHFLVKPVNPQKAQSVILRAIESLKARQTIFQFVIRKKVHTLYYEQIEYFESIQRKIIIHTTGGEELEYYGRLKDVRQTCNAHLFTQIHNSYIINMDYVKILDGECVILCSGETLPITKTFHKDFHAAYRNYVLMRMG